MTRVYQIQIETNDLEIAHDEIMGALEDARDAGIINSFILVEIKDVTKEEE